MQIIDNINHIVKNDLQENIRAGSNLSIAAACFSIYAYQELKKQLEGIDELRFIFTSPTYYFILFPLVLFALLFLIFSFLFQILLNSF